MRGSNARIGYRRHPVFINREREAAESTKGGLIHQFSGAYATAVDCWRLRLMRQNRLSD